MVNCQLLIVMPVIRTQRDIPPAPPLKGGRAKAKGDVTPSKGECSAVSIQPSVCHVGANHLFALFLCGVGFVRTPSAFGHGPRAVSRRSSEQGERKSGCPKRSELPDFPACKRHEGVRSARSLDLLVTFGSSQK